jgi:type II secretory pathway pseudopilin PulG
MIVLAVLATLLAIAVPLYLGVTSSAGNRAAQSDLNLALKEAKAYFDTNSQSYGTSPTTNASSTVAAAIAAGEPSLTLTTGAVAPSAPSAAVSAYVSSDGTGIVLTAWSKSQWCWILADNTKAVDTSTGAGDNSPYGAGGVPTGAGTYYGKVQATTAGACGADQALVTSYQKGGFPG